MGSFGATELLLVLLMVMILFGAKRLPGAARSLGQSMRIFKAETRGLREGEADTVAPAPLAPEQRSASDDTSREPISHEQSSGPGPR